MLFHTAKGGGLEVELHERICGTEVSEGPKTGEDGRSGEEVGNTVGTTYATYANAIGDE